MSLTRKVARSYARKVANPIAGGGGGPVEPTALNPMDASSDPFAIYAFERINPAYGTGQAFQVRDSLNTLRTMSFASDGTLNAVPATWAAYGDGVTFTIANMADQSAGLGTLTFSTRPKLIFPNAPTNYQDPYIDWDAASRFGTSANALLDIGGTNNLAVFIAFSRLGYGGTYTRPGAASTSNYGSILGYGTLANQSLLTSVAVLGNSQSDPTSASRTKDSLGRSTSVYSLGEELILEEAEPGVGSGFISTWFNQRGANVSGGGDQRRLWTDRPHGIVAANDQRLVLGATGNGGNGHNGGFKALVIYQGSELPENEAWGVGKWMDDTFGTQDVAVSPRYFVQGSGQSNIAGQFTASTSGDNTANTDSMTRRFRPKFAAALGITESRVLMGAANRTCVGGTAMMKRKAVGDPDNIAYWWDEDADGPGSLMIGLQMVAPPTKVSGGTGYTVGDILTVVGGTGTVAAQIEVLTAPAGVIGTVAVELAGSYSVVPSNPASVTGGTGSGATFNLSLTGGSLAYFDFIPGIEYKRFLTIHAQGEEDSTGVLTSTRINDWGAQTYAKLDYDRNYVSQPDAPIIVQPLARYQSPDNPQRERVVLMRRKQTSLLGIQNNVFIAADTGFAARGTAGNFEAHFGTMAPAANGGFDATTGGAEDGYQRIAWQNALAAAHAVATVYGDTLALDHGWRGPEVVSAIKTSSTTIDCAIQYPVGCLGTDISSVSGTLAGFRVAVAAGDLTISSTARIDANTIRLTMSAPLAIEATVVAYEPIYSSGLAEGANVQNQLMDDNPNLSLPVNSSAALLVA